MGDPISCSFAEFCMRGQGTDPDPSKAIQYLNKAVAAGSVKAMASLSSCYMTGTGVEKDSESARLASSSAAQKPARLHMRLTATPRKSCQWGACGGVMNACRTIVPGGGGIIILTYGNINFI
ncbi:hypothetical protein Pelo_9371 [Pelomyxa schiedti]|nr:hypothetical protein Pelo_9371 [Pelomyxa schiedti]